MLNSELLFWLTFVMLKWIVEGLKNLTDTAFWMAYICWTSEENLIWKECFSWEYFFEMVFLSAISFKIIFIIPINFLGFI